MINSLAELNNQISRADKIALYGLDMAAEIVLDYCISKKVRIEYILIDQYTVKPSECAKIPSRRKCGSNSFSEMDMMMDSEIKGIPVKRTDFVPDITSFLVISSKQLSENVLSEICEEIYSPYTLRKDYWEFQQVAVNELQMLRNCMKRQLRPTIYDFHFEFHIVEHCNLGCKGCTHFAPLAEEEYLDILEFEKDISRLSELTGGVARFINLLGGEPLLHPEIEKFFDAARKYFPASTIRVVTNGILLSKMKEEFWKSCRNNKIELGVTEYPIDVDYNEIRLLAEKHGVIYTSFSGDEVRDEMWKLALDEEGKNRPTDNFMRCPRPNACVFCAHGKIFTCATLANINHFNKYFGTKLLLSEDDYVDIYKVKSVSEILEYLRNPTPFCRYCNIERREYGVRWEKSERKKEEWT